MAVTLKSQYDGRVDGLGEKSSDRHDTGQIAWAKYSCNIGVGSSITSGLTVPIRGTVKAVDVQTYSHLNGSFGSFYIQLKANNSYSLGTLSNLVMTKASETDRLTMNDKSTACANLIISGSGVTTGSSVLFYPVIIWE